MISIIIPTLNEEKFLPNLLRSLSVQTNTQFEVIVVDGKSQDKTIEKALEFKKLLPSLIILESPKASLPLQRNLGAKQAKGDWLVFIDADGVVMPNFVDRIQIFIQEQHPKWFTTWCSPDSDNVYDSIFTLLANIYWESTLIINRPVAPGPLNCVRADVFHSVGGYNEEQKYNEDVEFGLRLSKCGIELKFLTETLYVWSMRRLRHESKIKVMNQYIISMIPILLLKRPFKTMPGYIMGGHLYGKKKSMKPAIIKKYEIKFKALLKEIFE
jgi:glycosyltransferase involved in cell wall biosynthesis